MSTLLNKLESKLPHEESHKLRRENAELRHQLSEALDRMERNQRVTSLFDASVARRIEIPDWTVKPTARKAHQVIPSVSFADWHFDEDVSRPQVNGLNAYNRQIALKRLERYFNQIRVICRDYVKGVEFPGVHINMLGDNFSGNIHEELRETNEDTILGSLYFWLEPVASGIRMLVEEFGKAHICAVVGNHGRNSRKPIAKNRVRDNFDWLFASLLKREFDLRGEKRITWAISESHKLPFTIYDTKFIASHGDEAKGGSGIAGLLSPLMIAAARLKRNFDFDYWTIGHWHQQSAFKNVRVSGSGKGYDEYAFVSQFEFQPPQQDLFFVAPKRGITASWPVFLE